MISLLMQLVLIPSTCETAVQLVNSYVALLFYTATFPFLLPYLYFLSFNILGEFFFVEESSFWPTFLLGFHDSNFCDVYIMCKESCTATDFT